MFYVVIILGVGCFRGTCIAKVLIERGWFGCFVYLRGCELIRGWLLDWCLLLNG